MVKKIVQALILLYKKTLSHSMGRNCSYSPSCSMYFYDAVGRYGAIVGTLLGIKRVMSCHPFAKGGLDPVKENLRGSAKWTL